MYLIKKVLTVLWYYMVVGLVVLHTVYGYGIIINQGLQVSAKYAYLRSKQILTYYFQVYIILF